MRIGMIGHDTEIRVAITPATAEKMIQAGHSLYIESGAGKSIGFDDASYKQAGCSIQKKMPEDIDLWIAVTPSDKLWNLVKEGSHVISLLKPYLNKAHLKDWAKTGAHLLSLELIPRITRAQSMDILSSQSNLAGYRAVIDAAYYLGRCLPLMMTAAGTIPAARVLIVGAGVAGLQAIATAKRLGAIVHAFDVRSSSKEQVESLGAQFVEVSSDEKGDAAGGYAKEMSDEYKAAQAEALAKALSSSDIVITTAQIPGKDAPKLITKEMVANMKKGSVIIDLASETGGNCELTQHGQTVQKNGVSIIAPTQILDSIAYDASQLFARNVWQLIQTIFTPEGNLNHEDTITKAMLLAQNGQVVHEMFAQKEESNHE